MLSVDNIAMAMEFYRVIVNHGYNSSMLSSRVGFFVRSQGHNTLVPG